MFSTGFRIFQLSFLRCLSLNRLLLKLSSLKRNVGRTSQDVLRFKTGRRETNFWLELHCNSTIETCQHTQLLEIQKSRCQIKQNQAYVNLLFRFELLFVVKVFPSKNVMTILLSDLSLILDQDCKHKKYFLLFKSPLSSRKKCNSSFKPNYNSKSISNIHSMQTSITFEAESRKQ